MVLKRSRFQHARQDTRNFYCQVPKPRWHVAKVFMKGGTMDELRVKWATGK